MIAHRFKRIMFAIKTENGIPTVGHGIARRVKRTILSKSQRTVYLGHGVAHRVKRTIFSIKPENGMPRPGDCSLG